MNAAADFISAFKESPAPGGSSFDFRLTLKAVTVTAPFWADPVGVRPGPVPPSQLRGLIPAARTTQSAVYYLRESGFTIAAAVVAAGALKPESTISYLGVTAPVITIAHTVRLSRQVMDDLPALEGQLNTRLLGGLRRVEETQILNGTGAAGQITGLMTAATITTGSTGPITAGNLPAEVAKAAGELADAGYAATGIVLNPGDYAAMAASAQPGAYAVPPGGPGALWGIPVALSARMAKGNYLVGQFSDGCQVFDREDASMQIAMNDRDNFVKDLLTARAEERLAFAIYQPGAFRKGS